MRFSQVLPSISVKSQRNSEPRIYVSFAALDDHALVTKIQAGERQAFTTLVSRWQDKVYTQCYRQLGDEDLAQEAAQEIFIKLYKGLGSFQFQAKFSTWLFRIVLNHCSNLRDYHFRRKKDFHEPLEGNNADNPRQLQGQMEPPDQRMEREEQREIIQNCLDKLPKEQREILILRDIQGFSYDEIAGVLDLNLGTVKSRVHRARNSLRPILKEALKK